MTKPTQQSLFPNEPAEPAPWELAAEADRVTARVVIDRPLNTEFHYLVPDELRELAGPGRRVEIPFGRGDDRIVGYCVGVGPPPDSRRRLKSIHAVLDREPLVPDDMLGLTRWIAEHYLCGWGQVLHAVVPAGVKKKSGTRVVQFLTPGPEASRMLAENRLPAKQHAVLETLCNAAGPMRIEEVVLAAGCGTGPVSALRKKGLVLAVRQRTSHFTTDDVGAVEKSPDLRLNDDQQCALDAVLGTVRAGEYRTILLHGVTGSGKTEVYIQAIREIVAYGRQAIVLVPEISLTPQTIRRFRSRFDSVAVLHSHLSDAERHWHWQQIARGAVQVVVGARSAVFAPVPHLGLIVIDEEHETSFKQESTPRYHAREVARQRAGMAQVPLILGSATPTLESWLRVEREQDLLVSMPRRVEQLPLPPVSIVDIRNDPQCSQGAAIGRALFSAMQHALSDGGQVILFLNLRGFAPVLWCRACGQSMKCPACDITLTWHKDRRIALCHSCDYETPPPSNCPHCSQAGMRYVGIGTQRLEHEVKSRFPGSTVLRMDSDSMKQPGSHDEALEAFRRGDVQILLGTQMIAKGLDFPNVTLVGVVDADTMLHQPDLRASERTFQLIAQVAGRTGRSLRGGRVLVQTSSPAEPAIVKAAAHDYQGFAHTELEHRRAMQAPPFQYWVRVILRGPHEGRVKETASAIADILRKAAEPLDNSIRILGPAPAPITRVKHNYRYHLQLAADDLGVLRQVWRDSSPQLPKSNDVDCVVDVEPMSMR